MFLVSKNFHYIVYEINHCANFGFTNKFKHLSLTSLHFWHCISNNIIVFISKGNIFPSKCKRIILKGVMFGWSAYNCRSFYGDIISPTLVWSLLNFWSEMSKAPSKLNLAFYLFYKCDSRGGIPFASPYWFCGLYLWNLEEDYYLLCYF